MATAAAAVSSRIVRAPSSSASCYIGDALHGCAVGNPHGLHRHGEVRAPGIVGHPDCDLAHNAIQFGLRVDVSHGCGGALDGRQRLQPARWATVHRGIGELRCHHDVSGAADGVRQVVVIFLRGGIREEDIERDHFGPGGGQRVDGAGDDLARPRKAAEPDHADFVNGHDRDIFGHRKRTTGAHQPVPGITADAGRLPVHQDAGRGGSQHDRKAPGDLRGACSGGQH